MRYEAHSQWDTRVGRNLVKSDSKRNFWGGWGHHSAHSSLLWCSLSFTILVYPSWELSEKCRRVGKAAFIPKTCHLQLLLMLSSVFSGKIKKKKTFTNKNITNNPPETLVFFKTEFQKMRKLDFSPTDSLICVCVSLNWDQGKDAWGGVACVWLVTCP